MKRCFERSKTAMARLDELQDRAMLVQPKDALAFAARVAMIIEAIAGDDQNNVATESKAACNAAAELWQLLRDNAPQRRIDAARLKLVRSFKPLKAKVRYN